MMVVPLIFQWAAFFSVSCLGLDFGKAIGSAILQVIALSVVSFRQWFSVVAAH